MSANYEERVGVEWLAFARYCNGLPPHKLKEPCDPLVVGAITDFANQIISNISIQSRIDSLQKAHEEIMNLTWGGPNGAAASARILEKTKAQLKEPTDG